MGVAVEEWRDIKGYEGLYKVSNLGNVYSFYKNRLLKPHYNKRTGYLYVFLCGENKRQYCTVHRLVGFAFVDGYKKGFCINHKNENKQDNRAKNLEWVSKKYNNLYNGKLNVNRKKISQIDMVTGKVINVFDSIHEAARLTGADFRLISAVCRGKRKKHFGSNWRYL